VKPVAFLRLARLRCQPRCSRTAVQRHGKSDGRGGGGGGDGGGGRGGGGGGGGGGAHDIPLNKSVASTVQSFSPVF